VGSVSDRRTAVRATGLLVRVYSYHTDIRRGFMHELAMKVHAHGSPPMTTGIS
jgi:hypothetical protein